MLRFTYLAALLVLGVLLVRESHALLRALSRQDVSSAGPATSLASKRAQKVCTVAAGVDLGTSLPRAWDECKSGGVIVIPEGTHAMNSPVKLSDGSGVALQIDGIIDVHNPANQAAIEISGTSDLEIFSSTGRGGLQGNGYLRRRDASTAGTKYQHLLVINHCSRFSLHDLRFADAQYFAVFVSAATEAEIYNLAIYQPAIGGVDAIDVSGQRIWVHDILASGMDECVTIKSPSSTVLVEQLYCNRSGGCAIGSLRHGTKVDSITYRNVYTW